MQTHKHTILYHRLSPAESKRIIKTHLWGASACETGVQGAVTDGIASAQPGEETFQTETVATVGGGSVPEITVSD